MRLRPVHSRLAAGLLAFAVLGSLTACEGSRRDAVESAVSDHVLGAADLTGWSLVGEPTLYEASTLYQRVNGEDGLYLGAGFTRLTTFELKQDQRRGTTAVVDVFELGSPLSAFGIYSRLHDEEAVVPRIGTSACIYGGFAVLYKDRFLVKINADPTAASSDEPVQGLKELAAKVADGLPGTEVPPCELGFLPRDGLDADSVGYVEDDLNGHDFLPGGLQADYRTEGQEVRVFLSIFPDAEAAAAALGRYGEHLGDAQSPPSTDKGGKEILFTGTEPNGGKVSVTTRGRLLVGVRGYEDARAVEKLMQDTFEAIEGQHECLAVGD